MTVIKSFPSLFGKSPQALILGTMPGKTSLELRQYYAHEHNQFWKIIFTLFRTPTNNHYDFKVRLIKSKPLALWDVLRDCRRENTSADSAIRAETPNDIPGLLARHPSIRYIIFNGHQAEKYFNKHFPGPIKQQLLLMPSTSPANARYSFEQKLAKWKKLLALIR